MEGREHSDESREESEELIEEGAVTADEVLERGDIEQDEVDKVLSEETMDWKIDKAKEIFSEELEGKEDLVIQEFIEELEDSYQEVFGDLQNTDLIHSFFY